MSRIGKKPISIPEGVEVKIEENKVIIKGPKGELSQEIRPEIGVALEDKKIAVKLRSAPGATSGKQSAAFWGLTRALLQNLIKGVTEGYEKKLEITGIGYKAGLDGEDLKLDVGFTHPVKIVCPPGITFSVEKNIIKISGIDKQLVGEVAAKVRRVRPPEPYKGKGIKYTDEVVRKKAGKKAAGVTK